MKASKKFLIISLLGAAVLGAASRPASAQATNPPATTNAANAPTATPAPPPSEPPKRSAADLEKLVAPMALYPDPLIATVLPASAYPLEIVQAARFVRNTNNISKLDEQPWDENVKAVARIPAAISNMDANISWTMELGDAFVNQEKEVMDAIQTMRLKAQKAGTLQTSPQQTVIVTNMVVENVTKEIVEIVPAQPNVIYVPTYNPATVYYPPYGYAYNPIAPLLTFGAGMAMGAVIANNCNWHGGGVYHNNVNVNRNVNINNNRNQNINNRQQNQNGRQDSRQQNQGNRQDSRQQNQGNRQDAMNNRAQGGEGGQKWQPDQARRQQSSTAGAQSREARGYGGSSAQRGNLSQTGRTPSGGGTTPSANRPASGAGANRPASGGNANRPTTQPSRSTTPSSSRPTTQPSSRGSSGSSAFSGSSSGSAARSSSSRGAASRSTGGGGGAARGGGGGRGGGGRR